VGAPGLAASGLLGRGDDLGRELAGDVCLGADGVEAGVDRRVETLRLDAQVGVLPTISRTKTSEFNVAPP
jgi:hypothetical protein